MASATEIATKALKRLSVVAAGETPAAADIADATDALGAMIAGFEAEGLSGDVLPLDARFEAGLTALLAVRLAEDYGKQPGPILMRDADNGWMQITAAFTAVPQSRFENAVAYTGNRTDLGSIHDIGFIDDNFQVWRESTEYLLRDFVTNEFNIYECITAGTSASSGGPTGTDSDITDGTAHWCWRRVDG